MRTHPKLENKLDAYERTVGENRRSGNRARRNWRAYAAAAGSGLALTTSAEAGIIYSGPLDKTASAGPHSSSQVATNINGARLTAFVARTTDPGVFKSGQANLLLNHGSVLANGVNLRALASGAKVSHGAGTFRTATNSHRANIHNLESNPATHKTSGSFHKSQAAFFGIKIAGDYGWVEVKWGGTAGGLPTSVTLLGWAYETTPGTAIAAGDTGMSAVPEPSTGLMGLLATGAGGVLAWRKRRQALAAATA